ncbi:MAG: acyltransferase [Acidobacteria bacterium]|nr:acyltransferase [Acidobacteriota bacterium]
MDSPKRSIPSLDGLRAIAVLLVIFAHVGFVEKVESFAAKSHLGIASTILKIDAGDLGVSLFFVISGYLITTLLLKERLETGRIDLKRFYLRRCFRIFPPFYFYLFVITILWINHRVPLNWGGLISAATYTSNYYPYSLSHPESQGWLVGHTWSLSLEEQFYLFWPVSLHFLGKDKSIKVGIALLLVVPVSRLIMLNSYPGLAFDGQVFRMFHTRIDTIIAGSVLALIWAIPRWRSLLVALTTSKISGLAALLVLVAVLRLNMQSSYFQALVGISLEGILLAYIMLYSIANPNTLIGKLLNNRVVCHFGIISYGLYLWQQLYVGPSFLFHGRRWLIVLMILGSAEISYWIVEKGSYVVRDKMVQQISNPPKVVALGD